MAHTPGWTPFDVLIEPFAELSLDDLNLDDKLRLLKLKGQQDGYRKAKVEDKDLLVACKRAVFKWEHIAATCACDPPGSGEEFCTGFCFLQAAIARARGGG